MKRFFIPPLAPILLAILAALCVLFEEGLPGDDAPKRAAFILIFASIPLYFVFLAINSVDLILQRFAARLYFTLYGFILLALSAFYFLVFYRSDVDGSAILFPSIIAIGVAIFTTIPMTLIGQLFKKPNKALELMAG